MIERLLINKLESLKNIMGQMRRLSCSSMELNNLLKIKLKKQ